MSTLIIKNKGGTIIVTSDVIKKKSLSLADDNKFETRLKAEDPLLVLP